MPYTIFIDESGPFGDPGQPAFLGGLLSATPVSSALLHANLDRSFPGCPRPHHAAHLNTCSFRPLAVQNPPPPVSYAAACFAAAAAGPLAIARDQVQQAAHPRLVPVPTYLASDDELRRGDGRLFTQLRHGVVTDRTGALHVIRALYAAETRLVVVHSRAHGAHASPEARYRSALEALLHQLPDLTGGASTFVVPALFGHPHGAVFQGLAPPAGVAVARAIAYANAPPHLVAADLIMNQARHTLLHHQQAHPPEEIAGFPLYLITT